jgi:hypothetical protein
MNILEDLYFGSAHWFQKRVMNTVMLVLNEDYAFAASWRHASHNSGWVRNTISLVHVWPRLACGGVGVTFVGFLGVCRLHSRFVACGALALGENGRNTTFVCTKLQVRNVPIV